MNRVHINSYQPDRIEISLDREIIIVGSNLAKYEIKFLHKGINLEGIVHDDRLFKVSLLENEDGYASCRTFSLDAKNNLLSSSEQSVCYLKVEYGQLSFTKKIISMTQIRAVLPINEDGASKVIVPIG